jgi:hypothetical protein
MFTWLTSTANPNGSGVQIRGFAALPLVTRVVPLIDCCQGTVAYVYLFLLGVGYWMANLLAVLAFSQESTSSCSVSVTVASKVSNVLV